MGRCKISFGPHKAHLYLVVGLSGSQNWARSLGFHNLIITYILFFIFFRPKQLIAYIPFTLRFFNLHLSRFIGLMPNSPLLSHLSPFIHSIPKFTITSPRNHFQSSINPRKRCIIPYRVSSFVLSRNYITI